jgi:hypothetical protein
VNCFTSVKKIFGRVRCHALVMFSKGRMNYVRTEARMPDDALRIAAEMLITM